MTTQELNDLAQRVAAILRTGGTDVTNLTEADSTTNLATVCVDTSGNVKKATISSKLATKSELNAKASTSDLQSVDNKLRDLDSYVGTIPSGATSNTIVGYIDERATALQSSINSKDALIAAAAKAVFVKLWQRAVNIYGNVSFGSYDSTKAGQRGEFVLNGVELTYEEAVTCFVQTHDFMSHNYKGAYRPMQYKTNLPVAPTSLDDSRGVTFELMFANSSVQKLVFKSVTTGNELTVKPTNMVQTFQGCSSLQTIEGIIDCFLISAFTNTFQNCSALVDITLINVHANLDFSDCPNISYDTLNDIVDDRDDGRYTDVITIKVHNDVWAKMQDPDTYPLWFGLKQKGLSQAPYYVSFTNS